MRKCVFRLINYFSVVLTRCIRFIQRCSQAYHKACRQEEDKCNAVYETLAIIMVAVLKILKKSNLKSYRIIFYRIFERF